MPSSIKSTKSNNKRSIQHHSQESTKSSEHHQSKRQKPLSQHEFFNPLMTTTSISKSSIINPTNHHHHEFSDHVSSDYEDVLDELPPVRRLSNSIKTSNSRSTSNSLSSSKHLSNRSSTLNSVNHPSTASESETSLWSEKYTPKTPSDLAVHPKKTELIQGWLKEAFTGSTSIKKYRRLLILGGPAGSGKSAIIRALAAQPDQDQSDRKPIPTLNRNGKGKAKADVEIQPLGYEILEWQEGGGDPTSLNFSRLSEFPSWLMRASYGPTLLFDDTQDPIHPPKSTQTSHHLKTSQSILSSQTLQSQKLLLVDELPNLHHDQTLSAFCEALKLHLNSTRSSTPPLVVIISDTTIRPGQEGADNVLSNQTNSGYGGRFNSEEKGMNARTLISSEILQHPSCSYIKLNSVNKTIMKKMLGKVLEHEEGVGRKKVGTKEIEEVVGLANGDIRAALNNLQFLVYLPGPARPTRVSKFKLQDEASVGANRGKKAESMLGSRESSLVLFHGLGKVLYNKRWGDDPIEDSKDKRFRPTKPEDVPKFLNEYSRRQSKTDIEALYSDNGINIDYFIGYLFQNYPAFVDQIEQIEILLEYMSFANSEINLNLEIWNQKPICSLYQFHITIRGILIGLPSPVPRSKKQTLKKSEEWEKKRMRDENWMELEAFRIEEIGLGCKNLGMIGSEGLGKVEIDEELGCFSLLNVSKNVMATEYAPYLAFIKKSKAGSVSRNPIIEKLSIFKLPKNCLLDRNELLSDDDDDEQEEEEDGEEEMGWEKRKVVGLEGERRVREGEERFWFEDEDEIED